jgi:mRNA interferase HigB
MHVITRRALRIFARAHADAEAPLDTWHRIANAAKWASIEDVRRAFPPADFVSPHAVFNIKGNTYRLIVKIDYQYQLIFIKHILTHAEYGKDTWK